MKLPLLYFEEYLSLSKASVFEILTVLLVILGLTVLFVFFYHSYLVKQCLKNEYWLPVVDDAGNVIGRVARSVSLEKPCTYQHPLIRIMVYKSGSLYLTPRTYELCPDLGKYDHPFERMMEYGKSIEETLEDFRINFFPHAQKPRFILRYKHENTLGQWQALLYILRISDEEELTGLDKSKGKFWTLPQIKENAGKSCFSSFLEGELEFFETLNDTD